MHVTADLRGGEAFSGPKDLMVGPGQTAAYPLTFRAPWIGDYVGNLDLNFPATGTSLLLSSHARLIMISIKVLYAIKDKHGCWTLALGGLHITAER